MSNNDPVVTPNDYGVVTSKSISLGRIFNYKDDDRDNATKYRVYDLDRTGRSSYLTLNGRRQKSGEWLEFTANQLSKLRIQAGTSIGIDNYRIRAFDGTSWSQVAVSKVYTGEKNTDAPIVSVNDVSIVENEMLTNVTDLFSWQDINGNYVSKIRFKDKNKRGVSGSFYLDGTRQAANKAITLNSSQLDRLQFRSGSAFITDDIEISAYDGRWSKVEKASIKTNLNKARPDVEGQFITVRSGSIIDPLELFAASDDDGNTIKRVAMRDMGSVEKSGKFYQRGNEIADGKWVKFNLDRADQVEFRTKDLNVLEYIQVKVFDGKKWSEVDTANISVLATPSLGEEQTFYLDEFEVIQASELFGQTDNGPRVISYDIIDRGLDASSGRWLFNGSVLKQNRIYTIDAEDLSLLQFRGGDFTDRHYDELLVRATNKFNTSEWAKVTVRTEPNYDRAGVALDLFGNPNTWDAYRTTSTLNYHFMQFLPIEYDPDSAFGEGFQILRRDQQDVIRGMLEQIESYTGLGFREVINPGAADLRFGSSIALPDMVFTGPNAQVADGWIDLDRNPFFPGSQRVSEDFWEHGQLFAGVTQMLGLEYMNRAADPTAVPTANNRRQFSINNIFDGGSIAGNGVDLNTSPVSTTLSIYDIAALQGVYGASAVNTGNSTYSFATSTPGTQRGIFEAIVDSGGEDTLDFSNQTISSVIDLREGGFSSVGVYFDSFALDWLEMEENISIAFGSVIENAIGGSSSETIIGNQFGNRILGGSGNDFIDAGAGNDYVSGGRGNDNFRYKVGDDRLIINDELGGGQDTLQIQLLQRNNFNNAITARKDGADLHLKITDSQNLEVGNIVIAQQTTTESRIETLTLVDKNGAALTPNIDLSSIHAAANEGRFTALRLTGDTGTFGRLVAKA